MKVNEASDKLVNLLLELELSPQQVLTVHRAALDLADAFTMEALSKALQRME